MSLPYCYNCGNLYRLISERTSNNLCDWCHYINDESNIKTSEEYDLKIESDYSRNIPPVSRRMRDKSLKVRNMPLGISLLKRSNSYRAVYRGKSISFNIEKFGEEKALFLAKSARSRMIQAKYIDEIEFVLEEMREEHFKTKIDPSLPKGLFYRKVGNTYDLVIKHGIKERRIRISKYGFKTVIFFAAKVLKQIKENRSKANKILEQNVSGLPSGIREDSDYVEYNHWIDRKRHVCKFSIKKYGYLEAISLCKKLKTKCRGIKDPPYLKSIFKKVRIEAKTYLEKSYMELPKGMCVIKEDGLEYLQAFKISEEGTMVRIKFSLNRYGMNKAYNACELALEKAKPFTKKVEIRRVFKEARNSI